MAKERIKTSLGAYFHHKGTKLQVNEGRYVVDNTREYYLFDVIPIGAPRMTQSDRWKTDPNHSDPNRRQRKTVTQYWYSKNRLIEQCEKMGFKLGKYFEAVYFIPMPDSWSEKKKDKMNGFPHESTPDSDNVTKFFKDSVKKNDSDVWLEKVEKRWAYCGSILVYV